MEQNETAVEHVRKEKNYGMMVPAYQWQEPANYEYLGIEGMPPELLQGYADNDAGNARRFLDVYGDDVRYCPVEKQWYICQNDQSWKVDEELLIHKLAYNSVHNSYVHELKFYTAIDRFGQMKQTITKLERGLRNIGNYNALKNCVSMAQKEVPITAEQFDRDPKLFHTPNVTLEVDSLTGVENQKAHYITKTAGAVYDCEALCPLWEQFVMQCVEGDIDVYRYLQKAAGYSILSGDIGEQVVFCLLGSGKNGKSLFINTLAEIAGDYACKIDSSIISMTRKGDKDNDVSKELYRMRGSRFVYTSEFNKNAVLNEAFVKSITDGGKISCRPLYGAGIEYQPTYTLWFSTNNVPQLTGFDQGIQRRFVLIPFDHLVTEPNKTLPQALLSEASGILNWLVEGYHMYLSEGLEKPETVVQAIAEYISQQDVYQLFVGEYYTPDDNGKVYAKNVYEQYRTWCQYNGEKPVTQIALSKELQRLGIARGKDHYGYYWRITGKQPNSHYLSA